jgi:hypothetical protein
MNTHFIPHDDKARNLNIGRVDDVKSVSTPGGRKSGAHKSASLNRLATMIVMIRAATIIEITPLSRNDQITFITDDHRLIVNPTIRTADVNAVTILGIVHRSLNAGVTLSLTIHT